MKLRLHLTVSVILIIIVIITLFVATFQSMEKMDVYV